MVALLKDNGEFTPMPVVVDTKKYEELKFAVEQPAKPAQALIDLIRANKRSAAK
jgi:hypothetical protein